MNPMMANDMLAVAKHLLQNGPRKVHPTSRRVRVLFNNSYIVDTTSALQVWEHDYFPQYYVPQSSLKNCTFTKREEINATSGTPGAAILDIKVPGPKGVEQKTTDRALFFYDEKGVSGNLAGLVRLEFRSMDGWLEEESPIYVHPKDPFRRIDILPSSRPITVKLNGQTLATATNSMHLLETGLPTRYYLPLTSVNQEYLRPSSLITKCPYKGDAEYYDIVLGGETYKNLVWYYRSPIKESLEVAGLVCFYNEKVDIWLDGVQLERPKTHFG